MKPLLIGGLLLLVPCFTEAADTAYSALRVFGKKEGEQALYRVVELRGSKGAPQPLTWKLVVDDPKARGGIREVEVRGGRIISTRTPVGRDVGKSMNFNQLNLDSDGAFTVVNQEAQKNGIAFDHVDYSLHSGSGAGAPLWEITLSEGAGRVGVVRVAADSGEILDRNFSPQPAVDDHTYLHEERPRARSEDRDRDPQARVDIDPGAEIGNFINRIGRHFQKRGRQLNNFFTGRGSEGSRD